MEPVPRLLAIDDSPTIRKAFELILVPAGYPVEFAATGTEGLEKARSVQPAVILLDFILPDMRGSEVARELLLDPRTAQIPVVLISTKGAEIRQAYQDIANVVAYITKPFTPDQVLSEVSAVLADLATGKLVKHAESDLPAPFRPPTDVPSPAAFSPAAAPTNGTDILSPVMDGAATGDDGWTDIDAAVAEDEDAPGAIDAGHPAARASLGRMFETLLAGLEGVYVEEVDTQAGAVADQAQSYTDLAARLARQLDETLEHATSGARFGLCSDGSIRSLADMLLDSHRRVCRLLFRAAAAGAVDAEVAGHSRARVLIVRHPDGEAEESPLEPADHGGDSYVFSIASDFRQLPLMTRLYGPTHLIVETAQHAALWDQLRLLRSLPEGQRLRMVGIAPANDSMPPIDPATLAELGIVAVVERGPGFRDRLRAHIGEPLPSPLTAPSFMGAAHPSPPPQP